MKKNFDHCFQLLLKDEGGYCNDPDDAGGPTKYGVTLADVNRYVKQGATAEDVKALTVAEAEDIYKHKYWDALDCDNLPSGVDYTAFDYGVNSGLGRPRSALKKFADKKGVDLINAINDERVTFLKNIVARKPSQQKFYKGWMSRVARVRAESLRLTKNIVAGPSTTILVGGTTASVVPTHLWTDHFYLTVAAVAVAAVVVGVVVHYIINRGKNANN